MSDREFVRASVLARVEKGDMTLLEGLPLLGISYRQAKRLYKRYRAEGSKGLVHGNVGRRSNHGCDARERERVLGLICDHYGGSPGKGAGQRFGPTLAAEHLWLDHGLLVPRSTLRDWMREAGLWSPARKSKKTTHVRRERRAHFGELVQMDGSFHDWYEGRGERSGDRSCMMSMVDDATSKTILRFDAEETIWAAARVLQNWIGKYGLPRALYTDWRNMYKRAPTMNERARGEEAFTQFGRMCHKLGIEIIGASSPQAKGRVERSHGTQQDRLVKKMRLLGISDDDAANEYVSGIYLPKYNEQFAVRALSPVDYHLPWNSRMREEDVFCLEHPRVVGNDYVVRYKNQGLQLDRAARGRVPARSTVIVRETEDGRLRVIHIDRDGLERVCSWSPAVPAAPLASSRSTGLPDKHWEEESAQPSTEEARARSEDLKARRKPSPNHPWRSYRKDMKGLVLQRRTVAEPNP